MRSVEFHHGLRQYRLTDWMACHVGYSQYPEVASAQAAIVLRAALAAPAGLLEAQIRSAFPRIDGGRAGWPIFSGGDLADRIAELIARRHMLLLIHDELVVALTPGLIEAAPAAAAITADQIRAIMPNAGTRADDYAEALEAAMTAHGIDTWQRRAAFLAQISVESGQLRATVENLNYSAARLMVVWPRRFPTLEAATPYANAPEALANNVYANRLGNGNAASGDGWRFRGRGLMQVTGRSNYRAVGFEANPEALAEPATAADTAAAWWDNAALNTNAATELARPAFNVISRRVNGGDHGSQERWDAYRRALTALRPAAAVPARVPVPAP